MEQMKLATTKQGRVNEANPRSLPRPSYLITGDSQLLLSCQSVDGICKSNTLYGQTKISSPNSASSQSDEVRRRRDVSNCN